MKVEPDPEPPAREIRVEGIGLLLLGGLLVALLAGAFWLGRASGLRAEREGNGAAAPSPPAPESAATTEVPSYFDTMTGAEKVAEPARQVPTQEQPAAPPPIPAPAPGPWVVQVFAGRDRRAAEGVVRTLTARGYPVRLDSEREGSDTLFKVRVGGYATEAEARASADRLKKEGETGAWVTRTR